MAEVENPGIAGLALNECFFVKPLFAEAAAFGVKFVGGGRATHDDAEPVEDRPQEEDDEDNGKRCEHGSI